MTTATTKLPITVTIPVGPSASNRQWLGEAIDSVREQTHPATQILLIDDQAHIKPNAYGPGITIWPTPWLSGVAHAFNFGVALARTELVVMLGSDDMLEPWALEDAAAAWEAKPDPLGYYSFDLKYMDNGDTQSIACNAAMVTKTLWRHTGGFPVQSAIGAPDAALLSILMVHPEAGSIRRIKSSEPPYLYRRHDGTDTRTNYYRFERAILYVRDVLTRDWRLQ